MLAVIVAGLMAAAGLVAAPAVLAPVPPVAAQGAPPTSVSGLVPIEPVRAIDTRVAYGGRGALAPLSALAVNVTGALGVAPSAVGAVSLNVTVTQAQAPGYLTVWPGGARPVASTINFVPGLTVPNGVLIGVDASGAVAIFDGSSAPVDVIVDVTGWVPAGAGFTPVVPTRVLETRPGSPGYTGGGALAKDETRLVDVVARAGVPAGAVGSVALNLTVSTPTGKGFLKAYPSGGSVPPTSSLNFATGQVVANSQVLGVGADGRIAVYAYLDGAADHVDVVIDVTGWFALDRTFHPIVPERLIDTRDGTGASAEPVIGGETYFTKIDALAGLPRGFVGAVALNITVTAPTAEGFVTAWPLADTTVDDDGHGRPNTSFVNFAARQTVANTVIVGLGAGTADVDGDGRSDVSGAIGLFVNTGRADLVVDVTGWFPQDTYGLVSDAVEARRFSLGPDQIAVVGCTPPATPFTADEENAVNAQLAHVSAYYTAESEGRYTPQYTWVGAVAPGPGTGESDCQAPATNSGLGNGFDAELVVRRNNSRAMPNAIAYGLAGPGFPCADPACLPSAYPDNGRDGVVTLNTLLETGAPASGTSPPFWMIATHEFGHTLDWPHSYTGTGLGCWGSQYDNPLDVMSRPPSGAPPSCAAPAAFPTSPQRTIAINRYAAGWLDPSLVRVHHQSGSTYDVGAQGSGAPELLIVPSPDGAAFTTVEVRIGGGSGPDATLQASGVVVHRVDQRPDPNCFAVFRLGLDRCSGLDRRVQPLGATPDAYAHVFGAGAVVDLGGVTLSVQTLAGGVATVRLDGTTATIGHIAPCGVYTACAGTSISRAPAGSFVCLVGTPAGLGRDIPTAEARSLPPDVRKL